MNNLNFYKDFYILEIERKSVLNKDINIPVLIITGLISIHFFLFTKDIAPNFLDFGKLISSLTLITTLTSLWFLIKSFTNFFSGHKYRELADMSTIRKYETDLLLEQEKRENSEILFNEFLISEFSECAKHNFYVNKNRTEDLAKAKIFIIISLLLTIIFSIVYIISII